MGPHRRKRGSLRVTAAFGLLAGLGLVVLSSGASTAAAARPSPSPAHFYAVQAWFDREPPATAAPGSKLRLGMMIWDTAAGALSDWTNFYVLVGSADRTAPPSTADLRFDWPGHLVATATVPAGGLGTIEVGVKGIICSQVTGACDRANVPMDVGGVGPPPGVPRDKLITGVVSGIVDPVAGVPVDMTVDLNPRADWDPATMGLPDHLVATVHHPREADLATVELDRQGGPGQPYEGSLTIPEAGDIVVVASLPGNGTKDVLLPSTTTRILVASAPGGGTAAPGAPRPVGSVAAGASPAAVAASPSPPGAGIDVLPALLVAGLGVLAIGAGILVSRVLADL